MSYRVCNVSGCPELTDKGSKCDQHRKADRRQADRKRPNATERGYGNKWRKARAEYLAAWPICEEPGCGEPATDVDHIDGLGPNGPRGYDWANFRSYCRSDHAKRTARDQPGGWNQR